MPSAWKWACVCAGGGTSGPVYNPVLAFSTIFPCGGHTHLDYCFIYWLGPLLGGHGFLLVRFEASSAASLSPSCPLRHVQLHPAVWEDPPVPVGKEPQTEAGLAGVPRSLVEGWFTTEGDLWPPITAVSHHLVLSPYINWFYIFRYKSNGQRRMSLFYFCLLD